MHFLRDNVRTVLRRLLLWLFLSPCQVAFLVGVLVTLLAALTMVVMIATIPAMANVSACWVHVQQ